MGLTQPCGFQVRAAAPPQMLGRAAVQQLQVGGDPSSSPSAILSLRGGLYGALCERPCINVHGALLRLQILERQDLERQDLERQDLYRQDLERQDLELQDLQREEAAKTPWWAQK